jgi:hypothetical protein
VLGLWNLLIKTPFFRRKNLNPSYHFQGKIKEAEGGVDLVTRSVVSELTEEAKRSTKWRQAAYGDAAH